MIEAKTLREVLASNMLDHPSATLPSMFEFVSNNEDDVQDVYAMVDRIIADDRLHVALSTPPADDDLTDDEYDAKYGLPGPLDDRYPGLPTPPADDVREAENVARAAADSDDVDEALWGVIMNAIDGTHSAHSISSAVRASFEVRLRGTVTEAEAEDVDALIAETRAFLAERPMGPPIYHRIGKLVAALEAAREVHP